MSIRVPLSDTQVVLATQEAARRQTQNEKLGLKGRNRAPVNGLKAFEMHKIGCIGEIAVAGYLGLEQEVFKNTSAIRGSADLPFGIEVKTRSKHNYDLLIQLDDDPTKIFVLATFEGDDVIIVGWINGCDAMKTQYIREFVRGRPCYAVPQKKLKSIDKLSLEAIENRIKMLALDEDCVMEITGSKKELYIRLTEDIIGTLNLEPGDCLQWTISEDKKSCILKKKS